MTVVWVKKIRLDLEWLNWDNYRKFYKKRKIKK